MSVYLPYNHLTTNHIAETLLVIPIGIYEGSAVKIDIFFFWLKGTRDFFNVGLFEERNSSFPRSRTVMEVIQVMSISWFVVERFFFCSQEANREDGEKV